MKSLIKNLANTKLGIILRNSINIAPVNIKIYKEKKKVSIVSDIFLWRTDNGFKTRFNFSDIINLFYGIENSWVEIHFYSKNNELIKKLKIESLNKINSIDITAEYIGKKDFGNFYIFHYCPKETKVLLDDNTLSNRCYVGYSQNGNLHSFVHGNAHAKYTSVYNDESIKSDIIRTSLFKNSKYTIQKYFDLSHKNEIFISNPTSKKLKFSINDKNYILKPFNTISIIVEQSIITIISNCRFLRPTVFSYKNEYLDVHHS
jgi:hypothetical protein